MGWKLRKREDVEPLLPVRKCFCWDLRMASFVGCVVIAITALTEDLTVFLDWLTYNEAWNIELNGGFPSSWKRMFWKGFVICDGIMTLAHTIIVIMAVITGFYIRAEKKIYLVLPILRAFYFLMVPYVLIELGISCYIYSWYGLSSWRLPLLIWRNLFNYMRFLINVGFWVIFYSYACEIQEELANPTSPEEEYFVEEAPPAEFAAGAQMPGDPLYGPAASYASSVRYAQA